MSKARLMKLLPSFRTPRAAPASRQTRRDIVRDASTRLRRVQRDLNDATCGFERGDIDLEDLCPSS